MKHALLAEGVIVKATDIILIDQVAGMFRLQWESFLPVNNPHYWAIEKEVANRPHIVMSTHTRKCGVPSSSAVHYSGVNDRTAILSLHQALFTRVMLLTELQLIPFF
jgi:hypothetical protein